MSEFKMESAGPFDCQPEMARCDCLRAPLPITEKNAGKVCKAEAEQAG